jgi:hypothetical protein
VALVALGAREPLAERGILELERVEAGDERLEVRELRARRAECLVRP